MSLRRILVLVSERYAKKAGAVFSLKYHIVWCPKYRRSVLVKPVDARLKALLRHKAEELDLMIHVMEVMPDHVHLLVEGGPTICVAEIVNGLKGFTSHALTLWSRSYYAGSAGSVSEAVVRKYIEGQKGK